MKSNTGIGIIGCGARIQDLLHQLQGLWKNIYIAAIFDPDFEAVKNYATQYHPRAEKCVSYNDVIKNKDVDWIMIGSWNKFHTEQIIAAFEAGKDVFSEKPAAISLEEHLRILKSQRQNSRLFLLGFTLRFSPHYRKIKELIESGAVGDILSIEFNETLEFNHGGYIMSGWRRKSEYAGPHVLEKCCHDFDIINWLVGDRVARTASFGGLNFFIPENSRHMDRIGVDKQGRRAYCTWLKPSETDPFSTGKTIVDNQVAILEFYNGVRASFHTNLNAGQPERRIYLIGTEGSIRSDVISGELKLKRIGFDSTEEDLSTGVCGMHGGGDAVLCGHFANILASREKSLIGIYEGIESAAVCLAVNQSRVEKRIVEMTGTWKQIDTEYYPDKRENIEL
jgi:predicted dehydrogenase